MKLVKTELQNGLSMWYRDDDKYIGQRIALQKYEEYESVLIIKNINKDSVAVDVGANIGYYTLLLAKVCKKVYAFEPDKVCFIILKKNIEENNLKNVVLFNSAVSNKKGKVEFIQNNENFGDSKIVTSYELGVTSYKTKTIKLDDEIKEKIDLIKIDVQGYEEKVIEGAKKIIKKYKPILFMEFNGGKLDFLKRIYKNIYTIDYWFYVLKIGIEIDKKTGYADLLITNKNIGWWERYKNLQWKKVIKKILGYNKLW